MNYGVQAVEADEILANRPFTLPRHTAGDRRLLCYLADCLWLTLLQIGAVATEARPILAPWEQPDQPSHRQILNRPGRLREQGPLPIVGFFGQRRPGADRTPLEAVDDTLIAEMPAHRHLLAYCSTQMANGDFGNLVVFDHEDGFVHWRRSQVHGSAVIELAPAFYASVRIYNGELPHGLADCEALRLYLVKYYDYDAQPIWRGQRPLHPAGQAG